MKSWYYDELRHCGVDYSDNNKADNYDLNHQSFRNYEKEFNEMVDFLELTNTNDLSILDLGCGTGAILSYAAERFKKVYAVDVSEAMLNIAKKKLSGKSVSNVDFTSAGFLTYRHDKEPVDLLATKAAFHHLPDFWKQIGLLRMNQMIKLGGILYIHDVIFHFEASDYIEKIDNWVSVLEQKTNTQFKEEVETHIRDEFSTFKWILDGMIEKAGFKIESCRTNDEFITEYHCIKIKEK